MFIIVFFIVSYYNWFYGTSHINYMPLKSHNMKKIKQIDKNALKGNDNDVSSRDKKHW